MFKRFRIKKLRSASDFGFRHSNFAKKPLAVALIAITVFALLLPLINQQPQKAKAAWFSQDWSYRQKIIIDHNKVPNTDQTDFPVLIKITDTNNPIFSSKVQDDGDDIRFTSNDETTLLNHEIESFSKSTHELWAWVKVPTLSHETDTIIYLYYGNNSATAPVDAFKQAVWSNGYAGVWHLNDPTDPIDSTANVNNGTNYGSTIAAGQIGMGGELDGVAGHYISIPESSSINFSGVDRPYTLSAWTKRSASGDSRIFLSQRNGYNQQLLSFGYASGSGTSKIYFSNYPGDVQSTSCYSDTDKLHYLAGAYNGDSTGTVYRDGLSVGSGPMTDYLGRGEFGIGRDRMDVIRYYKGAVDEVRISSTARSADWIATEYANQNSPETFFQIRSEISQVTAPLQTGPTGWYDLSWGSRQPITFDHTKVPNTDQTDFPVLVKITDSNNNLWSKAQADGNDILFTSSDGTTKLAHEIEKYDSATHELWAWVKIPTLLHTDPGTTIYMYYGNASASSQQSKTAVWSNGYAGVWHLDDPANLTDSTSNANNGTNYGTVVTGGKIASAGGFDGLSQYMTIQDKDIFSPTNGTNDLQLSSSAWISRDTASGGEILGKWASGGPYEWKLGLTATGQLDAAIWNSGGNLRIEKFYSIPVSTSEWHYVSFTYDASKSSAGLKVFLNGIRVDDSSNNAGTFTGISNTTRPVSIGANSKPAGFFKGTIDEAKISSAARSADWIATEYANQNSPETFEAFGIVETADSFAPNNPTIITSLNASGGEPLGNAGTDPTPYYSWPEPEVAGGATDQTGEYVSGVAGYYSYFGTSCGAGGADPFITRGLLSDTGSGLHYSSDTNIQVLDLSTNEDSYCLRIKTRDIAGNISTVSEVATYNFDLTNPNPPTFIAVNPAGYSSTDSFDFSWPAATDNANGSGIQGYQYKRGNGTDEWSATQAARSANDLASYQTGENIFIIRSVDKAGNYSDQIQTTYYYSSNVPTKPTSITPSPDLSDTNSFSFSWTAPVHFQLSRPITEYGYSINAAPTTENLTWTGSDSTSLPAAAYATQQGVNTIYIVAKDDSGAYGLDSSNYGTATFNCTTAAPPIPTGVSISDSSNRQIGIWALTIKWSPGIGQSDSTFDHYLLEKSSDGATWSELASTTSLAYIDTGLDNGTTYSYRLKAVDNAASTSANSTEVSRQPTGKYTTPPTIVTEPTVSVKSTTATINWVVARFSSSSIRFGKEEGNLERSQVDPNLKTDHSILLVGLDPSTTYYYQVQSLDTDREYSADSAYSVTYSFTTLASPTISNVTIANITLNTADISWDTSTASNTKVYYGPSISYGEALPESVDSMTTKHTVKLSNLDHSTKYHFKIMGGDLDDNRLSSDDYTFETLPLPKISNIAYQPDGSGPTQAIAITWTTNVATTSSVEYTPTNNVDLIFEESQSAYVTTHKVLLRNLSDDTDYGMKVSGSDSFGNIATSDNYTLKTSLDTRPSTISDITIETSNVGLDKQDKAQIAISWKTDEPTTSLIEYGEGTSDKEYTHKTTEDKALTTNHLVIIPDLTPGKPYHIRVVATDKGNNITRSEDHTVIPGDVPRSALQIILQTFTRLFGWLGL